MGSPGELLAVVPHLLGFVPQASLVVIGTAPPRDRIKVTLRYDLPDPPGAGIAADIAAHAVGVIGSQRLTAMTAVGYGTEVLVDPVAYALRDAARQAGIDLLDVLRVEDGRYWSYACGDEACCPAAGAPFDPATSSAAAAMAAAGISVLADRAEVAARVAPVGGSAAASMRQATRRAERRASQLLARVRKSARLGAARQMIAATGLNAVRAQLRRVHPGPGVVPDPQVAQRHRDPRDLVVGGVAAATAVGGDHGADRVQPRGRDHLPRGAQAGGLADLGEQLAGVPLGPVGGLAHGGRGAAADRGHPRRYLGPASQHGDSRGGHGGRGGAGGGIEGRAGRGTAGFVAACV